ncbi:DUF882 domain-containing protein [Pseudahrensia aquimaris]|uniref:Murein endopeptidase K n=1 Tax=Pseudahrensia aquimaris TaxID=744461 RepID=A0ABW3FA68_9HYPH
MASLGVSTCKSAERVFGSAFAAPAFALRALVLLLAFLLTFASVALANAETRTLRMYYTHTKESITVTYKKNGKYQKSGLRKLNRFLRDFRRNEPTRMDPELFDIVWEIYQASGSRKPIHVISGYRSPRTNKMLRRRGRKVAKNSQHTRGKALDFFLPDVPVSKLRALALKAHAGGVGFYRGSFIHVDTGRVRHWPRMSRRQLSKVFPRGRTIHVPSDGRKMKGYKTAAANLRKGLNYDGSRRLTGAKPTLLARIFNNSGGDGDESEGNTNVAEAKPTPAKKPKRAVAAKPAPKPAAPKGPDPFAQEVAAVSAQRGNEQDEAAKAAERIARVIVPTPRPRIAVPESEPQVAQAPVEEAQTELALATPSPETPIVRPVVDVNERTGNTVASGPTADELDALKSRIQTALARQRQLSAAERATEQLTQRVAKLAVPAPRTPAKQEPDKPVLQAALQPTAPIVTTPSWRQPEPEVAPVSQVPTPAAESIAAPKVAAKAADEPALKEKAPAVVANKSVQQPTASMIGELALGNLEGETVKEWAIATSTRVGPIAALQAPSFDQGTRRIMPGSVYSPGFESSRKKIRSDRFTGRAMTRVAFARVAMN